MKMICKENGKSCHWIPTGNIRATTGKNINISMYCKTCNCREEVFLTEDEFKIQEKIIGKEVDNVQAR